MALKEIKVEWDTFNFKVWCVIGSHRCLPAYVMKRHRRIYRGNDADDTGCYFPSRPKSGAILWLSKVPRTPKEHGYLAHEIGHAVIDMFASRNISIDSANDETFCYAIAHGVTGVLKGCK